MNDFIVRAAALALEQVPDANAMWDAKTGKIRAASSVDVAIAVATDSGLITPIVKQANTKSLQQISGEVSMLQYFQPSAVVERQLHHNVHVDQGPESSLMLEWYKILCPSSASLSSRLSSPSSQPRRMFTHPQSGLSCIALSKNATLLLLNKPCSAPETCCKPGASSLPPAVFASCLPCAPGVGLVHLHLFLEASVWLPFG